MRERRLFVIAPPRFSAEDAVWLAGVRERHDPLSQILPPHVTVGAFDATSPAESLVDRINRGSISVIGTVESLRTVAFDGKAVQTITETSIGGHSRVEPTAYPFSRSTAPAR